ncbi:hypothetical protein GCM10020227_61780 [Streptomyces flavovirens]
MLPPLRHLGEVGRSRSAANFWGTSRRSGLTLGEPVPRNKEISARRLGGLAARRPGEGEDDSDR